MAKVYPEINSAQAVWIAAQPLFFVSTAPLSTNGHVNLSPRGLDTFRVLGPREVAWLDLHGSGNETAAHLAENGRITVMFCAFAGEPKILRLYGRGEVIGRSDRRWTSLLARFPAQPHPRQIVRIDVSRVQTSCGFGVPLMELVGQRMALTDWAERKGEAGLAEYRATRNHTSIDGLSAPDTD